VLSASGHASAGGALLFTSLDLKWCLHQVHRTLELFYWLLRGSCQALVTSAQRAQTAAHLNFYLSLPDRSYASVVTSAMPVQSTSSQQER
jgi:hypothetical protein